MPVFEMRKSVANPSSIKSQKLFCICILKSANIDFIEKSVILDSAPWDVLHEAMEELSSSIPMFRGIYELPKIH